MHSVIHPLAGRGLLLAATLVAMVACGDPEASLDDAVVATPTDTLTGNVLRDILLQAPAVPGEDASLGAVSIWTDLAMVVGAATAGDSLDEATLTAVMLPAVMERTAQRFGESRAGSLTPTPAQIDSVARGNTVRVFRRYIIGPIAPTDTALVLREGNRLMRLKQQAAADGTPAAAMRSMGDAAEGIEVSEPLATARQEMPEQLAANIWRLGDNELSDPILGNGAIQLFERVPSASAREQIGTWLTPVLQRRADAQYIDSVVASRALVVADDGAARLRDGSAEPGTFASDAPLASWSGGELSTAEARRWLGMMPAAERARLRLASDTSLTQTLDIMARREIIFDLAVASGIDPYASREELLPVFREQLAMVMADAREAGDPTVWFRDVLEGRRQFRPLPGALAAVLRERTQFTVHEDAREAATREAARSWQPVGRAPRP